MAWAILIQAVHAIVGDEQLDEALLRYLSTGRKHFATDAQVRRSVQTVAFYWQGRASQKKLILRWLEDALGSKEVVDPAGLTIEHVLPRTMTDEVRAEFAAGLEEGADVSYEHDRFVHTLGNLTLSGHNGELNNKPSSQKREMPATSGLLMNQGIAEHASWGLAEITERGANLAEKIIELWLGPDEELAADAESAEVSALRSTVSEILASIPAGNWTSYGEVAIVAGTYPQPLAAVLARYKLLNAWRVLQTGGTVSPGFRWFEPSRTDDPREVLAAEGAGIGPEQAAFFDELRQLGQVTAKNIPTWRRSLPQHWYNISTGSSRATFELTENSVKQRVSVQLYILDDQDLIEALRRDRAEIENELGISLDWRDLPGRKASRIMAPRPGDFRDPEQRAEIQRWMVETVDNFARVFRPRLEVVA